MPTILIPGSYDIPTKGHEHLWRSLSKVGDVVIAVGRNAEKKSLLAPETRAALCERVLSWGEIPGRVHLYDDALVDAIRETKADLVVRGVRGPSDLEEGFVFQDHLARCGSAPIAFVPAPAELRGVSSSLVRQVLGFVPEMTDELKRLLPEAVYRAVRGRALQMSDRFVMAWREAKLQGDPLPIFGDLLLRYSARRREYHTLEHIRWALHRRDLLWSKSVGEEHDWLAIEFALWFHDAVMEGKSDDEIRSADLARSVLAEAGASGLAVRVHGLILATGHETTPADSDEAVVVDSDLSVLGGDKSVFDHYEALIRAEWAHVPEDAFRAGRAKILQRFLDRPSIYATEVGRGIWEKAARANLERSIARLKSGEPIPGATA